MSLIRFIGDETKHVYDIPCDQIGGHVIRLTFDSIPLPEDDILYSGFEILNEHNGDLVQGDMTGYIYFYRKYTKDPYVIELSDEDIPFDESTNIDNEFPEGGTAEPTFPQLVNTKLRELSNICNQTIVYGLTIDNVHYSYTLEDQLNLESVKNTVQITGLPLGYHANDQDCADYTAGQFLNIYIQLAMNKYCNQTYYNQARSYLRSLENTEENKELVAGFVYGQPLPEEYKEKYDHFVSLYENQIRALGVILPGSTTPEPENPEEPEDKEEDGANDNITPSPTEEETPPMKVEKEESIFEENPEES